MSNNKSNNMKDLLNKMSGVKVVNNESIRTPMTKEQIEDLKAKLTKGLCMNVYPNQFDISKPFRVALRYNNEFFHFGNFNNLNVAMVVGNIASMAYFGDKAVASKVNLEEASSNQEFKDWMEDERNNTVIERAFGQATAPSLNGSEEKTPLVELDLPEESEVTSTDTFEEVPNEEVPNEEVNEVPF